MYKYLNIFISNNTKVLIDNINFNLIYSNDILYLLNGMCLEIFNFNQNYYFKIDI